MTQFDEAFADGQGLLSLEVESAATSALAADAITFLIILAMIKTGPLNCVLFLFPKKW